MTLSVLAAKIREYMEEVFIQQKSFNNVRDWIRLVIYYQQLVVGNGVDYKRDRLIKPAFDIVKAFVL